MAHLTYAKQSAASVPTPPVDYVSQFIDTADGIPKYKDETGTVTSMEGAPGPTGPAGNSLARPKATLTSTAGSAIIDLSTGTEVYAITLTENTTISFTNLPASGYVAELRVRVTQHASAAKTCAFSGTSVKYRGPTWSPSAVLSSVEDVGISVDSAGNVTVYPGGVLT